MCRLIIYVILSLSLFQVCQLNNIAYNIPDPECTGVFNLCTDIDKERLGREAIQAIHEQMDDDKDGMIEPSESSDFIKEELESKTDSIRHRHFQNASLQITFNDLWTQWRSSVVYNWSTDNVVDWLVNSVDLPQYIENFRRNQFDGRMIPRLVINEKHYLSSIMQIRDLRDKRRLIIKATDVVLFGPPQRTHNLIKDMILISASLISFGACLYAFIRHRKTQESMNIMLKELETLQKAEGDLISVTGKIKAMENELKDKTKPDRGLLNSWFTEVQRTKEEAEKYRKNRDSTIDQDKQLRLAVQEIEQLRIALRQAEEHAQHQSYEAPGELIDLLKRTYLIEEKAFEIKRKSAENAMLTAKDQMTKISKMQKGFFGAVRIAHSDCMDNISELISSAKQRLADVQDDYEEREQRWNRIASLIDREDLVSISSVSTASMGGNQYLPGSPNISLHNGTINNVSTGSDGRLFSGTIDTGNRSKQTSMDSNTSVNINNDSTLINKSNSSINNRGVPINPAIPLQVPQQDVMIRSDSANEFSNLPSSVLKRRAITNSALSNNRSSSERLFNNSKMVYSHSTNGLNNSNINSTDMIRPNLDDSLDILSLPKQIKPTFDIISDQQFDSNDSILDDHQQYDKQSQLSDSTNDEQRSVSSPEKKPRQSITSKLLKPFQNLHFRKKSNTS